MNDFGTVTAPDTVRIERVLPGPIERVWAYLTESDKRASWLAAGEMDLRAGGRVALHAPPPALPDPDEAPPPKYAKFGGEIHMGGRILECEPPNVLAYTWGEDSGDSQVRFELSPRGDEVLLVVTHSRLLSVASGWHAHLGILADRLAGRTPPGFWATHTRLEAEYDKRIPAT